jgi:hypothetical protein
MLMIMDTQQRRSSWIVRLLLALAGTLYLTGAAADPLLHAFAAAAEVPAAGADLPHDAEPPAPHDDAECAACKAACAPALPVSPAGALPRTEALPRLVLGLSPTRSPSVYVLPHPRGPPSA